MATKPEDIAMPSRRAMVGALAALPAAGVPMLAHAAAASPDPIFALIAAHKALDKEWSRLINQRTGIAPLRVRYAREATEKAGLQMAMTEPTTPAGAAAMINYAWPEACKAGKHAGAELRFLPR